MKSSGCWLNLRHSTQSWTTHSPTKRVGGDLTDKFEKVAHKTPMLSLSNSYSADEVAQWAERVKSGLPDEEVEFVIELKYDGVAISLWYEEGALVKALTRGDGTQGEDVRTMWPPFRPCRCA